MCPRHLSELLRRALLHYFKWLPSGPGDGCLTVSLTYSHKWVCELFLIFILLSVEAVIIVHFHTSALLWPVLHTAASVMIILKYKTFNVFLSHLARI